MITAVNNTFPKRISESVYLQLEIAKFSVLDESRIPNVQKIVQDSLA
jgi:hypothetical protein